MYYHSFFTCQLTAFCQFLLNEYWNWNWNHIDMKFDRQLRPATETIVGGLVWW